MIRSCARCGAPHRRSHAWCKTCHAAYMREWRTTHGPSDEQRRKGNCRSYANVYLRRGKLHRGPCADCGVSPDDDRVEMHHEDYSKPLEVTWLCRGCREDRRREAA